MYNPVTRNDYNEQNYSPYSQTTQFHPIISNTSPSIVSSTAANDSQEVQFAPNFLFGSQQSTNRRSFATPSRLILPGYGSPGILKSRELSSGGNKNVHWSPQLVRERSPSKLTDEKLKRHVNNTAVSSLINGPPLRSLNDDIFGPPEKQSRLEVSESMNAGTTSLQLNQYESRYSTEIQLDEANDEREEDLYWVTIFGFQRDQREALLELFSRHGDIMTEKTPKHGNWMHIRYSSPVHAKQALAKNGTIFQNMMIGVITWKDREALDDDSAFSATTVPLFPQTTASTSNRSNLNGSMLLEQDSSLLLNGSKLVPSTSAYKSNSSALPSRARLSMSSRAGMRPLNSSCISTDGEHDMNSSLQQHNRSGVGDDSFMGKLWNMFTSGQ